MIHYLIINLILTSSALFINIAMQIPHRIKFIILMTALLGWLVPFSLLTIEVSQNSIAVLPIHLAPVAEPVFTTAVSAPKEFTSYQIIALLMVFGLFRFMLDLFSSYQYIHKLKYQHLHNCSQIRLVSGIKGAFVSGYFKPIIWIDEKLSHKGTLQSIIIHERQHIKNHDQFWLLLMTLIQRLFWFNPFVHLLVAKLRMATELRCDEACKKKIGKSTYQSHLAELIIDNHKAKYPASNVILNNHIQNSKNFNIQRIKQLNQENTMTYLNQTKLCFIAILTLMMCTYSLVTVANDNTIPTVADHQVLLSLEIQRNDEQPAEISILTNQGETAHVTYDNHDFGFTTQVSESEPTQIYTQMSISKIENGVKTEIAKPGIVTTNTQWGAFKFGADDTYFDINIMGKTSSDLDPTEEAIERQLRMTNPIPPVASLPNKPDSVDAPAKPMTPASEISSVGAPLPVAPPTVETPSASKTATAPQSPPVPSKIK